MKKRYLNLEDEVEEYLIVKNKQIIDISVFFNFYYCLQNKNLKKIYEEFFYNENQFFEFTPFKYDYVLNKHYKNREFIFCYLIKACSISYVYDDLTQEQKDDMIECFNFKKINYILHNLIL